MIKVVSRNEVISELGQIFKPRSYILKFTDKEDTDNIVSLCSGRKKILEIGTLYGHTTENIARYNPNSEITTLNITKQYGMKIGLNTQTHELLDEAKSGMMIRSKNIIKLVIDSDSFFEKNDTKWDAIFLDGDHSRTQVEKDTTNALKHIIPGGIIIWHDIYNKDNKCQKCLCEPSFNDVREYLETLPITINKIERSWVGYYVQGRD